MKLSQRLAVLWQIPDPTAISIEDRWRVAESSVGIEEFEDLPAWAQEIVEHAERLMAAVEKFNPYHSTATGRFTTGGGFGGQLDIGLGQMEPGMGQKETGSYNTARIVDPDKLASLTEAGEMGLKSEKAWSKRYDGERDNPRGTDLLLADIAKEQGFTGKPQVVSKKEMDNFVKDGEQELFRGMGGGPEAKSHVEAFRSGEMFCGRGTWGSGAYCAAPKPGSADQRKRAVALVSRYGKPESTLRMTLRKDAKVITSDKLSKLQSKETADLARQAAKASPAEAKKIMARQRALFDGGRWAAAHGYDAINVGDGVMVILNRTAVRVQNVNGVK